MERLEDYDDESSELSPRYVHRHYTQQKNGNGNGSALNKVVWSIAGFLAVAIVSWIAIKVLDLSDRTTRLETIITIERLGQPR